jgi:hypothetical protein
MGRTVIIARLIVSFLLVGKSASAQTVSGTVVDTATSRPVGGAAISVLAAGAAVGAGRTNDSGRFEIKVPAAGSYTVRVTRLGYGPTTTSVRVEGSGHAAVYRLSPLPTTLAPVTSRAAQTTVATVTPGRDMYRAHLALNTGQMASGVEIQQSKLTVTEFLGRLIPGLQYVKTLAAPAPGADQPSSPATVPGRDGFVIGAVDPSCLFARIDRWSLAGLLDVNEVPSLDDILSPADVMGVEVYTKFADTPPAYRIESMGKQLVWRTGTPGRSYFVGDLGIPWVSRPSIRARQGEYADERRAPSAVEWFRSAGQGAAASAPLDTLWEYCRMKYDKYGVLQGPSAIPRCTQVNPKPDSVLNKIIPARVPIDTVRPASFALPSMSVPLCGFVQVWTRVAW